MKKERTLRNVFTLVITVLLLVTGVPANVFADEFEDAGNEEAIVMTLPEAEEAKEAIEEISVEEVKEAEAVKEEATAVEEKKEEEDVAEVVAPEVPVEVQEKKEKIKVTVTFEMINSRGQAVTSVASSTLSEGSGWNVTARKAEVAIANNKNGSANGINYEWAGTWVDTNGNEVKFPLSFKYADLEDDVDMHIIAVYNVIKTKQLHFNYIDKVSTGSGSWSNVGSFSTHTHTFKQPEDQANYQFLYWEDVNTGAQYGEGDKVKLSYKDLKNEEETVEIHAIWQPSITIRYFSETGELLMETESFTGHDLYSYTAEDKDGMKFLGWSSDKAEILAEDTKYAALAPTFEKVSQTIYDVYAIYETSYAVEHYIEDLDGSYILKESETIENVIYGSSVSAEAKEYEGFSFDETLSEADGIADPTLVLKMYYNRNRYTVTWKNEDGSILELDEDVMYGAMPEFNAEAPKKSADASYTYIFNGWTPEIETVSDDATYIATYNTKAIPVVVDNTPSNNDPIVPETSKSEPNVKVETVEEIVEIKEAEAPVAAPEIEDVTIEIAEAEIPQAAPRSWALVNLIAAIAAVLTALGMVISFFRKKEEEDEQEEYAEEKEEGNRKASKFLGLIPALVSVILFILTEDVRNPMVLIDEFTLWMIVISLVNFLLAYLTRNEKEEEEEERRYETVDA